MLQRYVQDKALDQHYQDWLGAANTHDASNMWRGLNITTSTAYVPSTTYTYNSLLGTTSSTPTR